MLRCQWVPAYPCSLLLYAHSPSWPMIAQVPPQILADRSMEAQLLTDMLGLSGILNVNSESPPSFLDCHLPRYCHTELGQSPIMTPYPMMNSGPISLIDHDWLTLSSGDWEVYNTELSDKHLIYQDSTSVSFPFWLRNVRKSDRKDGVALLQKGEYWQICSIKFHIAYSPAQNILSLLSSSVPPLIPCNAQIYGL
jgi:hypothetical protein